MNMITRIEKMLNEQGIKRSTMLADLDIPSSTFSTWKKKGSDPDLKSVIKLANYLGVSMDYILNGETGNIQKIELDDEPIQICRRYSNRGGRRCYRGGNNKQEDG